MLDKLRTRTVAAAAALLPVLGVVGCGDSSGGDPAAEGKLTAALVMPCTASDPWCGQALSAAKKLESEGKIELKVTTNAPQDTAGISRVLAQYAQSGTDLVIAHSTWGDAVLEVAKKFADTHFATYGSTGADNVALLEEPLYEASYLAGMLAGDITKSGVIGGTAGQDIALCHALLKSFELGAQRVRKGTKMIATYIGDWNDAAKGRQATMSQHQQGSDVAIACGGGPANGMVQAIKATNTGGFGYMGDMRSLAPKNLVGSVTYNLVPYYTALVNDLSGGGIQPGKKYHFGLAQGGVDLTLNPDYPANARLTTAIKEMEKVKKQIVDGTFKVPYVTEG
ncbi:BMP family protein [Actinomadura sp. 3N508]|uniref:BMP family protein n=1 Tax=Actinomadura sp. 3N508 TaxID=3375153 RepID=UPI0037B02F77